MSKKRISTTMLLAVLTAGVVSAQLDDWRSQFPNTDFENRSIDLSEIRHGGPPKDGIPSIDNPRFIAAEDADHWISDREPVIVLELEAGVRIYPLQILTWHEIVNDRIGDTPVSVTFCPLCYSAIAFNRRLDGRVLEFGVTGLLRHSDMIMYDRQTESLWQQAVGEAIVGQMNGKRLRMLPAALIAWRQARQSYPQAQVLSRETGFDRDYGRNPYAGYDDVDSTPMMFDKPISDKVPPMEHLVTLEIEGKPLAYRYSDLRQARVVNDQVGDAVFVVIFETETGTALGDPQFDRAEKIGASAVFERTLNGQILEFELSGHDFADRRTGSKWNIFGQAVDGPLKGSQLKRLVSGDFFAFAWLAFREDTEIRRPKRH